VRQGYEAWNSGDRSWVLEHMSPEVEWISPPEDPEPGHYHGYEGVQQFWEQWRAAVGQLQMEVEELVDADEHVVAVVKRSGVGESSGLAVSDRVVQVFTFDGATCVKVQEFYDKAKALKAAGAEAIEADSG
jgi:ketosteroid isomerase-like protein